MKRITITLTDAQLRLIERALAGHYLECDPKEEAFIIRVSNKLAQAKTNVTN